MANPAARAIPSAREPIVPVSRYLMFGGHGVVAFNQFSGSPAYFPMEKYVLVGWVAELSPTAIR